MAPKDKNLNPAATRHLPGQTDLHVGSFLKVVMSATAAGAIPGGLNSAAALVSYSLRSAVYDLEAETEAEESISAERLEEFWTQCAGHVIEDKEDAEIIFDCDTGLFGQCDHPEESGWEPLQEDRGFYHSALMAFLVRSMVEGEVSRFFAADVCIEIECIQLFARERLRAAFATDVVAEWASWSTEDEVRRLEFNCDNRLEDSYATRGFLYTAFNARQDARQPHLLACVRFQCELDGAQLEEEVTMGVADINPWLECALWRLSLNLPSFLLLPRTPPQPEHCPIEYSRMPNVWPGDEALCDEALAHQTRYFGISLSSCKPGAFGVVGASEKMKSLAQTRSGLIFRHLMITGVQLLPDIRSVLYDPEREIPIHKEANSTSWASDDESLSSCDVRDESDPPVDLGEFIDDRTCPDEPDRELIDLKMDYLKSMSALGLSLYKHECWFDSLRIFDYGWTNLKCLLSNKTYARTEGIEHRFVTRWDYHFKLMMGKTLYHLGEHVHGLYISQLLVTQYPDGLSLASDPNTPTHSLTEALILLAHHELKLQRFQQALTHIQQADPNDQQVQKLIKWTNSEIVRHSYRFNFNEQGPRLYQDKDQENVENAFLSSVGIQLVSDSTTD